MALWNSLCRKILFTCRRSPFLLSEEKKYSIHKMIVGNEKMKESDLLAVKVG